MSTLDQLKTFTTVVADTGDFECKFIKSLIPSDCAIQTQRCHHQSISHLGCQSQTSIQPFD